MNMLSNKEFIPANVVKRRVLSVSTLPKEGFYP